MGKNQQSKGTKMSIGEFIGPASSSEFQQLPTGPKERSADDDGSFRRHSRRDDDTRHEPPPPSRSDADGSWRRSAPASGRWDTDRSRSNMDDRAPRVERSAAPVAERPRLSLARRTVPLKEAVPSSSFKDEMKKASTISVEKESINDAKPVATNTLPDDATTKSNQDLDKERKGRIEEKKKLEPAVINSRAAALEAAPSTKRDMATGRDSRQGERMSRGPLPIANKRFEALVSSTDDARDQRRDSGPASSLPPLEPTNSRFAMAAEADRSFDRRSLPPMVQNSRFGGLADADRSNREEDRRGPPPPLVQNSRFAGISLDSERESMERDNSRRSKDGFYKNNSNGPPLVQNSRLSGDEGFSSDSRNRSSMSNRENQHGDDRRNSYDNRRVDSRQGAYDDRRKNDAPLQSNPRMENSTKPSQPDRSRVADLLKPKARTLDENVLKVPGTVAPQHADNMLKFPSKTKNEDDEAEARRRKEEEEATAKALEAEAIAKQLVLDEASLNERVEYFISGEKLGNDLKQWCLDTLQGELVTKFSVETLVFKLLMEREKKNPDPECSWADPNNYGAALVYLVGDNVYSQMQVLWGIQKYCDKLGFPKLNEEYLVQAMFRAMYKYDLVLDDSFMEWKEDDSENHQEGKLKAVIQTVDWFTWLEQDEEEEEEEEEEE